MINFDPHVNSILPNGQQAVSPTEGAGVTRADFSQAVKALGKTVSKIDEAQHAADASVQDLLTGKNNDITAVVSAVSKADMSFKVLVGVRNKLIEAYKQAMNMPL